MANHDFSALYDRYATAIAELPETFASNEFILKLAEQNQALYVEALYAYRQSPDDQNTRPVPFMKVHGILAHHLRDCPDLVEQLPGQVSSRDIFGNLNQCAHWRKKP